jgi:hypothetical protein
MTDEELVKWLRNEHRKYVAGTTVTTTGYSQAADNIEALTAENERLLKTALWLGEYSSHENDCRIMTHGVWSDPIPCTCGYTDAWQAHLTAIRKQP